MDIREQILDLSRRADSDEEFHDLCRLLLRGGFANSVGLPCYMIRRRSDGSFWYSKKGLGSRRGFGLAGDSFSNPITALKVCANLRRQLKKDCKSTGVDRGDNYDVVMVSPFILKTLDQVPNEILRKV